MYLMSPLTPSVLSLLMVLQSTLELIGIIALIAWDRALVSYIFVAHVHMMRV